MQSKQQEVVAVIAELRREVRSARRLAIAAMLVPVLTFVVAARAIQAPAAVQDVVRARRIEVVVDIATPTGTETKTVAAMSAKETAGMLSLSDAGGSAARIDAAPGDLRVVGPETDFFAARTTPVNGKLAVRLGEETGGSQGLLLGQFEGSYFLSLLSATSDGSSVALKADADGSGRVEVSSTTGKSTAVLTGIKEGVGLSLHAAGEERVLMFAQEESGASMLHLRHPTSTPEKNVNGVCLWSGGAADTGGELSIFNKTNEEVCTLKVDEYGNGLIGAWDRTGKGRTLKPGN